MKVGCLGVQNFNICHQTLSFSLNFWRSSSSCEFVALQGSEHIQTHVNTKGYRPLLYTSYTDGRRRRAFHLSSCCEKPTVADTEPVLTGTGPSEEGEWKVWAWVSIGVGWDSGGQSEERGREKDGRMFCKMKLLSQTKTSGHLGTRKDAHITCHREKQMHTTVRYHFIPTGGPDWKAQVTVSIGKEVEKILSPIHFSGGHVKWFSCLGK